MEMHGYKVDWKKDHKYITFTTPDGHKCRDNKLFAEQLLRKNLEIYFTNFNIDLHGASVQYCF